jgi:signal peptidase I
VPLENVIGRAIAVAWPSNRWHGLPALTSFEGTATALGPVPVEKKSDTGAGWVLVVPILAGLVIPARSRRLSWPWQRRLLE